MLPRAAASAASQRKRRGELLAVERLDQKTIHAGGKAGVAILGGCVGGQRDDRRARTVVLSASSSGCAAWLPGRPCPACANPSARDRRACRRRARQASIRWRRRRCRHGRAMAELDQKCARQQRIDLVVLGDQDRERRRRRAQSLGISRVRPRRRDRRRRRPKSARRAKRRAPA